LQGCQRQDVAKYLEVGRVTTYCPVCYMNGILSVIVICNGTEHCPFCGWNNDEAKRKFKEARR